MTLPIASRPPMSTPLRAPSPVSSQPAGASETAAGAAAGAAAAEEANRVRQAILTRYSDGFDGATPAVGGGVSPTSGMPDLTGTSAPGGTAPTSAAPTGTEGYGTAGEVAPTSGVPTSGDPMLDQWDPLIAQESAKWGVPPENLKALIAVESGGDPNAVQVNPQYGNTYGLCQVNPEIWGETAAQRGYDLATPEGNVGFAASLLRDHYDTTGSWDQAHSMYFNPAGTGDSVNGTSNDAYVAKINEYINSWR